MFSNELNYGNREMVPYQEINTFEVLLDEKVIAALTATIAMMYGDIISCNVKPRLKINHAVVLS